MSIFDKYNNHFQIILFLGGYFLVAVGKGKLFLFFEAPEKEDVVVEGKRGLCGFHSTNLDFILRSKCIKNVAIAGFLTNCCVESTMRTAYESGYNVVTLTDCCAGLSTEEHNNAIEKDFPMFSQPMASTAFLEVVKGAQDLVLEGKGYE
ncbi:cysteine hydrolase [Flavobacteriaceae bacterium]|nr:cysteine hydrolase [Flavobacteriaceae bacterium]